MDIISEKNILRGQTLYVCERNVQGMDITRPGLYIHAALIFFDQTGSGHYMCEECTGHR